MPSGCTTHCPPTIHWYSVFWRNESPMPPCQPAMPTPLRTAFSRPCSCSRVMLPIVQTGTTRLNDSIRSRSRYTSNVSQTSTWKPFDCRIGAKTSVHCLGSCPSQPPQTINALFISLYSSELLLVFDLCLAVQLASRQSHRQRRRLCAGAGDMHVFAALRCVLEGVHHIQDVVGQCAVRAVRPAAPRERRTGLPRPGCDARLPERIGERQTRAYRQHLRTTGGAADGIAGWRVGRLDKDQTRVTTQRSKAK